MGDVASVGGKNASLGEMLQALTGLGVKVPGGFATTADAYREFLAHDGLDKRIQERLSTLDVPMWLHCRQPVRTSVAGLCKYHSLLEWKPQSIQPTAS